MIQPINTVSFKAIESAGGKFTPLQQELRDDIVKHFTTPDKHKKTIEKFYEMQNNSFRILPIADDKVELHRLTDVERNKNNEVVAYRQAISEGIFDSTNNKFDPRPYLRKLKLDWIIERAVYTAMALIFVASSLFFGSMLFKD